MSNKEDKIFFVAVSEIQAGQRLDRLLASADFIPSRSRAADLIDAGLVTLNGRQLKASYKTRFGDRLRIELPPPPSPTLEPLASPLDILFEDDDLVVVNKPAGLVVHPAAGHAQDTLVNILLHHVSNLAMGFAENRPGIVHRLDRDTSGILVVAKNDHAHHGLAQQFRLKTAHRIYWALVFGVPPQKSQTVRSHLARHPRDRKRFASNVAGVGKLAITHYKVLQALPTRLAWLQCQLETGRTHQIRVHLSESGFPILGDQVYGAKAKPRGLGGKSLSALENFKRLALHACELGFDHPRTLKRMMFQVDWPVELRNLAQALGFQNV